MAVIPRKDDGQESIGFDNGLDTEGKKSEITKEDFQITGMSSWKEKLKIKLNWRGGKDHKLSFSHVQMHVSMNERIRKEQYSLESQREVCAAGGKNKGTIQVVNVLHICCCLIKCAFISFSIFKKYCSALQK